MLKKDIKGDVRMATSGRKLKFQISHTNSLSYAFPRKSDGNETEIVELLNPEHET